MTRPPPRTGKPARAQSRCRASGQARPVPRGRLPARKEDRAASKPESVRGRRCATTLFAAASTAPSVLSSNNRKVPVNFARHSYWQAQSMHLPWKGRRTWHQTPPKRTPPTRGRQSTTLGTRPLPTPRRTRPSRCAHDGQASRPVLCSTRGSLSEVAACLARGRRCRTRPRPSTGRDPQRSPDPCER